MPVCVDQHSPSTAMTTTGEGTSAASDMLRAWLQEFKFVQLKSRSFTDLKLAKDGVIPHCKG